MHVFLTGATGYIGSAAAEALRRAGHEVTGLARSPEAAAKLEAAGITPVAGDLRNPASIGAAARMAEGVIHTAMDWGADTPRLDEGAVRAILDALPGSGKPFIYTSGVWVMGDTGGRVAGEMAMLRPTPLVAWRPAVERLVLDASSRQVRGVVLRPAMVYGRGGGMLASWVKQAREQGFVRIVGSGENHWSFVHVDDLADLYVRALERSPGGELYLAAFGPAFPVKEVAAACGRVETWPLEEARKELGPMADALALDQQIGSTKAGRMLGWSPAGASVIEELVRGSYAA